MQKAESKMTIMKPQGQYFKGREKNRKRAKRGQNIQKGVTKSMVLTLMELAQEPAHTQTGC